MKVIFVLMLLNYHSSIRGESYTAAKLVGEYETMDACNADIPAKAPKYWKPIFMCGQAIRADGWGDKYEREEAEKKAKMAREAADMYVKDR